MNQTVAVNASYLTSAVAERGDKLEMLCRQTARRRRVNTLAMPMPLLSWVLGILWHNAAVKRVRSNSSEMASVTNTESTPAVGAQNDTRLVRI